MKRKKLNKTFMMISNWKYHLVSMVNTKIFQSFKGWQLVKQVLIWTQGAAVVDISGLEGGGGEGG